MCHLQEKSFLILSDSLASLQAIDDLQYDHSALIKIHELYSDLIQDTKETFPDRVGVDDNLAVVFVAKNGLDG